MVSLTLEQEQELLNKIREYFVKEAKKLGFDVVEMVPCKGVFICWNIDDHRGAVTVLGNISPKAVMNALGNTTDMQAVLIERL